MSRDNVAALREQLGREVQQQQAAVDAVDAAAAAYFGVNRTDLRCLEIIAEAGTVSPSQLAAALGLTTGSVTTMVDRLVAQGYVARSPDPSDRRKIAVRMTPEAARMAAEVYGPVQSEGSSKVLSRYTAAQLRLLLDFHQRSRELQERHAERIRTLWRQST